MNAKGITFARYTSARSVLTAVLVALLELAAYASVNSLLHGCLHSDHQSSTHDCLVTALEHGHCQLASVRVAVVPVDAGVPVAALRFESVVVSFEIALPPERGPPVRS
jgi:hypothetical protein